jgi:KAP-like P-loop domain-containing protein
MQSGANVSTKDQNILSRLWNHTPRAVGFLIAIIAGTAAALLISAYGTRDRVAKELSTPHPELHRPANVGPEALVILVALIALLGIALPRMLPKARRSLRLGLIPVQKWVWLPATTVFWIAYEWNYTRVACASIIFGTLATATELLHRRPKQQGKPAELFESDLPLAEDGEDLLGRREMVESLVATVLLESPAVIAVTGAYGDGKTSFLNLAIGEMKKTDEAARPIIVRFSPWLAGDSNAIVLSMLDSIVAEIKREFFVPGLSGDAARYARTLLSAAPWTERIKDIFTEPSQERRIEALVTRIEKTGRRVLVVLDDLDRMEAKELETVFKLLRGTDQLSNITFLCSFYPSEVASILSATRPKQDTNVYIEKFFPVVFPLLPIEPSQLRQSFLTRLTRALEGSSVPREDILKSAEKEWDGRIGSHFRNLRKIKLFFNRIRRSLELMLPR